MPEPGGLVRFDNGVVESAFGPTWTGGVNVAVGPNVVLAGPDQGGGPNLATFDPAGNRIKPDVYVGDHPDERFGLFPYVDPTPTPTPPPAVTLGTGRLAYVLDFSAPWAAGQTDADFVRAVAAGVAARLAPLDVTVTTVRPAGLAPGTYVTGQVLTTPGVSWYSDQAIGLTTEALDSHNNLLQPLDVYAGCGAGANPDIVATELAHEFGHAVGLPHRDAPDALMRPVIDTAGTLDAAEVAQANADIDRFEVRVAATAKEAMWSVQ